MIERVAQDLSSEGRPGDVRRRKRRPGCPSGDSRMENLMREKKKNIGLVLLFVVGLSILLYPTVSNTWNEYRAKRLISAYRASVSEEAEPEMYTEMLGDAREYNGSLAREAVPDAFSVRDGIEDEEYEALLNLRGDGVMGSVEIPAIGVDIPIYHYTTEDSLQKGAGHLFGSSLPVGGEGTHTILSAHRGLPSAELFTDLPLLEEGDVFYLHVLNETLAYEVDQKLTVLPGEVGALAITEEEDYATLVTCTPYAINSHRVLVRGHRIPFVEEVYVQEQHQSSRKDTDRMLLQVLSAAAGLAVASVIVWVVSILDDRKRKERWNDKG